MRALCVLLLMLAGTALAGNDSDADQPAPGQSEYAERTGRLLAAALEAGDDLATARAQHDMARHMMTRGLWPQALTHATLARQAADEIDDPDTRVMIDITYASVLQQLDRAAEATGILLTALEQTRALGNTEQELWALLGLSSAYVTSRQLPEARGFALQGLALARDSGDRVQEVRFLSNLGLIAWTGDDVESAALHIRNATAVQAGELPPDVHKTLILASITLAGTTGETAAARAREVIAAARQDGSRYMEGFATEQLGHILCGDGDIDPALAAFEAADVLFQEVERLGDLRRLHQRWADCLAGAGRFEEALARQRQAMASQEAAYERRQNETLQAHDIAFRTEQRLTELARLAGEEQALQARVARQRTFTGWLAAGTLLLLGVVAGFWARNRRLREMRDAEHALQRARVDLLARTSHEIRNPAQGVIGILESLPRHDRPAAENGHLDVALAAARMIGHLANDFLDMALLEQGRLRLRTATACHLPSLVQGVMTLGQAFVPAGRARLSSHMDPAVPEHVCADGERLTQVLLNLVANAAQYAGDGQIRLHVGLDKETGRLEFTVDDCGPGIPPELVASFDPYVRGQGAENNPRGSGLGLAISARIVRAMGGAIVAGNRPEGGARMVISLPLVPAPQATHGDTPVPAPGAAPRGVRVLVVDDDHFARLGLCTLLQALGAQIRELDSESSLLECVDTFDPALVLMDLHINDVLGTDLARRIRERDAARGHTRIIAIVSGSAQPPEQDDPVADCWLMKPVGRSTMSDLLARL